MSSSNPAIEITFLGTGTSIGVPAIGCDCEVCLSDDPKNKRTRSSIHVKSGDLRFVIDTGPDFRAQCLREGIRELDAALFTHAHSDHILGFDDLRRFTVGEEASLPIYATASTLDRLRLVFEYVFNGENRFRGYLKPDPVEITGAFQLGNLQVTPIPVEHGRVETIGFLLESSSGKKVAYVPDVKTFPPSSLALCREVDVLIINSLQLESHWTHLSVSEAVELAQMLEAKRVWCTHLTCRVNYREIGPTLPRQIDLAWDGLQISV